MEMQAPAVVAVVVTSHPDDRLDQTITSLLGQDYEALQILVMLGAGAAEAALRVARVSPQVLVHHLEEDRGFGAAVNRALELIEGAAFFLLCHDDVTLAPDAVHLLVEESFRSNAGIVTPKVVTESDPSVLLHVGQSVDRYGSIVERVLPGEIDQGQHDSVRDVFVAPGGVTLVREDLLRTLGGYDERYLAMGDDLELCWRARLVGARLVCAPQAVVTHAERLAAGERPLVAQPGEGHAPSLSRLHRRNEVRTLQICWGLPRRVVLLVTLLFLNLAEILVAAAGGDHDRAVDIRESWRQAWRDRRINREARKSLDGLRSVSDSSVRSFQTKGATRLRTFASTFFHHGYDAARGVLAVEEQSEEDGGSDLVGFGGAFSDDEGFDELDDLGNRVRRERRRRRRLSSARSLVVVMLLALAVYVVGSRNLIGAKLPLFGQLLPLGSWWSVWHHVFASWQPSGLGSGAPGHPGYATLGLFGIVTLGQMGALIRLLLLAAIPLGSVGIFRLLRPAASMRARLLGALAFAGLALGANDIAAGSISGLAALAAAPFLVRRLLRLGRVAPFDEPFPPAVPIATRGWRRSEQGQVLALGLLIAVVSSIAPAVLVTTLVAALGIAAMGLLDRGTRPFAGQLPICKALGVALALLAPLVVVSLFGGLSGLSVFGNPSGPWSQPGIGGLLRFAVGPNGGSGLAWLLPAAALVPLLIGRRERLALSARLAGVGLSSAALALWVSRGGWGSFAPDLLVVLAPLAAAMAALVGLGLAAMESDLLRARFGWRQLVGTLGVAIALLGLVPAVAAAGNGRWKMPVSGYGDALGFLSSPGSKPLRVLWLGDPRAIPGSSWPIEAGLSWSTSAGGLPGADNLFQPPSLPAASAITDALHEALSGRTTRLGQLLAPTGIVAIVVPTSVAPTLQGLQTSTPATPPAAVMPALSQQRDLLEVPGASGTLVFESAQAMPVLATRSAALAAGASASSAAAVIGWSGLGGSSSLSGLAPAGSRSLYLGLAPADDFVLHGASKPVSVFGWSTSAGITASSTASPVSASLSVLPLNALIGLAMVLGWLALALALLGRHRWLDWWWPAAQRARSISDEAEAIRSEDLP